MGDVTAASASASASLVEADPHLIRTLPVLVLFPHNRCNCRCLMCDIWKEKEPRELTEAEVASFTRELAALGTSRVVLSGGEALMHSDLFALCRPLRQGGIALTLLTSGLHVSRRYAQQLPLQQVPKPQNFPQAPQLS